MSILNPKNKTPKFQLPSEKAGTKPMLSLDSLAQKPMNPDFSAVNNKVDVPVTKQTYVPTLTPKIATRSGFNAQGMPENTHDYSFGDYKNTMNDKQMADLAKLQIGGWSNDPSVFAQQMKENNIDPVAVDVFNNHQAIGAKNKQDVAVAEANGQPKEITTPAASDIYQGLRTGEQTATLDQIKALAAQEAAKPLEPIPKTNNPLKEAGFGLTGAASGAGAAGLTGMTLAGAAGTAGAVGAAAASPLVIAGLAGFGFLKSEFAFGGANRQADVEKATGTSAKAMKYAASEAVESANPNRSTEQAIQDYYATKRSIYQAYQLLYEQSLIDLAFRRDEGQKQMATIEEWMRHEDELDRKFFYNLANKSPELYAATAGERQASLSALSSEVDSQQ